MFSLSIFPSIYNCFDVCPFFSLLPLLSPHIYLSLLTLLFVLSYLFFLPSVFGSSSPSTWLWPETTAPSVCVATAGLRTPWTTATTLWPVPFTPGKTSCSVSSHLFTRLHTHTLRSKADTYTACTFAITIARVNIQQTLQQWCRHDAGGGFCSAAIAHVTLQQQRTRSESVHVRPQV